MRISLEQAGIDVRLMYQKSDFSAFSEEDLATRFNEQAFTVQAHAYSFDGNVTDFQKQELPVEACFFDLDDYSDVEGYTIEIMSDINRRMKSTCISKE